MSSNYIIKSHKPFDKTLESLKENLMDHGFGVLWAFDLKGKMLEKGFEFDRNYMILEVCNPKQAHDVISVNHEAGLFLPCKVAIYEEHGDVYVGMPKPTALIGLLGDDKLDAPAHSVESSLKSAILKSCEVFHDQELS